MVKVGYAKFVKENVIMYQILVPINSWYYDVTLAMIIM